MHLSHQAELAFHRALCHTCETKAELEGIGKPQQANTFQPIPRCASPSVDVGGSNVALLCDVLLVRFNLLLTALLHVLSPRQACTGNESEEEKLWGLMAGSVLILHCSDLNVLLSLVYDMACKSELVFPP